MRLRLARRLVGANLLLNTGARSIYRLAHSCPGNHAVTERAPARTRVIGYQQLGFHAACFRPPGRMPRSTPPQTPNCSSRSTAAWPQSTSTGQPRHHLTARARSAACSAVHSSRVMGSEQRGRLPAAARDSSARLSLLVAVMRSRLCWCRSGSHPSWRRSNALDSSGAGRVYFMLRSFPSWSDAAVAAAPDAPCFFAFFSCLTALDEVLATFAPGDRRSRPLFLNGPQTPDCGVSNICLPERGTRVQ